MRMDTDAIALRCLASTTTLPWREVLAIHLSWTSDRSGSGYSLFVRTAPSAQARVPALPYLADEAEWTIRRFIEEHGIDVPVNPAEPWRDRLGGWHGPLLEFDPLESIRTIRKAAIGPCVVRVRVRGDLFEAVTEVAATGEVIDRSSPRATLAAAVDDGVAQVKRAQALLSERR